jgi:hypothetical protein
MNLLQPRPIGAALPDDDPCCHPAALLISERRGSRRRRIWELGQHAHCPVIGVCLPLPVVRRLADKVLGGQALATDYALHCGVNSDCRQRSPMAEAVQKELDRRYLLTVRQSQKIKTTEALAGWWQQQRQGDSVPGALWATLTHPRCDALLEERVLQDIHLLQHQAGAANRADLARLDALLDENRVLANELARAQERCTRQAREQAQKLERTQSELMLARAALVGRDTLVACLREDLAALEASIPDLRSRQALSEQLARQLERIQHLERALLRSQQTLEMERLRQAPAEPPDDQPPRVEAQDHPGPEAPAAGEALGERAVLCVGGRPASVPAYRRLIEEVGARFLHHDGGEQDHIARLDSTLAAADLVICQTGCISHDAYWRVKDHCKRTGKRCVFVDKPSAASLRRALVILKPVKD